MKKKNMLRLPFCNSTVCFFLLWCFSFGINHVSAQCFSSSGNPVGGSQNMGSLDPQVWTIMGFSRYGYFDRYFEGDQESDLSVLKNADYIYSGMLVGYGLNYRLSLEMELGYFFHKTKRYVIPEDYELKGYGWSNTLISAKYRLLQNQAAGLSWSLSGGLKIPFSRQLKSVDHVRLPFDIQPSTGAFGAVIQSFLVQQNSFTGMRYFLYNRLDVNGKSREGYRYGTSVTSALFISRHLIKTSSWPVSITLIGQFRNEYRDYNRLKGELETSSGSVKFFASPQINFAIHDVWNLSVILDIPVYQYYNNIQLAESYTIGLSVARIITPY